MANYKNPMTLDGRIALDPRVTEAKFNAAANLLAEALHGNRIASGKLAEVHTTSDLPFSMAQLISTEMIPQFDEDERVWSQLAGVRTVRDFNPVKLYGLYADLEGAGVHENGGLLDIPEAAPYPYVTVSGQESFYQKLSKKGVKFGKSWESEVNDIEGFYENIPNELLTLAYDTEEREVMDAVKSTTNSLAGGTLPDGTVIAPNAAVSVAAISQAIYELETTEVNGKKVGASRNGYNVVVGIGDKRLIDYELSQNLIAVQDGSLTFSGGNREWIGNFTVIESADVTGGEWYVLPKPGGVRRPVVELMRLRGYEAPELRANGNTGVYLGSSAVVPFNQGSWENDTIDYRLRYVCGGVLWDDSYVIKSDGSGTA